MARSGQQLKVRIVARLLPPESSPVEVVSQTVGISVVTLVRWRAEVLARRSGEEARHCTPTARLEAVIVTAAMNEAAEPSYSRPRVSDDNPYAEAVFRTGKYRPEFPVKGFVELDAARTWAARLVDWYYNEHRHSGIKYVTPAQRHAHQGRPLRTARHELYRRARHSNPRRWSRQTCDWTPVAAVMLNPERDTVIQAGSPGTRRSGSTTAPAFPYRPDRPLAAARNVGEASSAATRSHTHRPLRREHGEDGEHRIVPEVSTVACSGSAGRQRCHRVSGETGVAG